MANARQTNTTSTIATELAIDSKAVGAQETILASSDSDTTLDAAGWQTVLQAEKAYKILEKLKRALGINGLLLTEQILAMVKEELNHANDIKIPKNGNTLFSVIKATDGTLYALYHGKTHEDQTQVIGEGKLGRVKYAQNLTTGEVCVVKIQKPNTSEGEFLNRQKLFLATAVRHKDTVREKQYIFMKIVPGVTQNRLLEILKEKKLKLSQGEQACILLSAFNEIKLLMANGIDHFDLHDENIMIDPVSSKVKVIDFGYARDSYRHTVDVEQEQLCDKYMVAMRVIWAMYEFIGASGADGELDAFLKHARKSLEYNYFSLRLYDLDIAVAQLLFPVIRKCMEKEILEEKVSDITQESSESIQKMFGIFSHKTAADGLSNKNSHNDNVEPTTKEALLARLEDLASRQGSSAWRVERPSVG